MRNRKGFMGPIGDDLPSLLMVILAMGLFFSAVLFVFDSYNQKLGKIRLAEGALEAARVATAEGAFEKTAELAEDVQKTADSYGISVKFDKDITCDKGEYSLVYFAIDKKTQHPAKLVLCVRSK